MVVALSRVRLLKTIDNELLTAIDAALEHASGATGCDVDIFVSHVFSVNVKHLMSNVLVPD